jgi:hypothetical protein
LWRRPRLKLSCGAKERRKEGRKEEEEEEEEEEEAEVYDCGKYP